MRKYVLVISILFFILLASQVSAQTAAELDACKNNPNLPMCKSFEVLNCADGIDNDGDGLADCDDPQCTGIGSCVTETDCGNGIDDDNDGFVDYYDGDCLNDPDNPNDYIVVKPDCEAVPVGNQFDITVAWQSANQTSATFGMPMVADVDNDGTPEVISYNATSGRIFILNGKDGTTERSTNSGLGALFSYPAVADVDKDGTGELFVVDEEGYLKAYNHDLSDFWGQTLRSCYTGFGRQLGLADFDGDGEVELYQVNEIRNSKDGSVIIAGSHGTTKYPSANDWGTQLNATPVAVDILPQSSECPDCNGLELVVGHIIYSVDIAGKTLTERGNMNNASIKPTGYPATGYFLKYANYNGQSYSSTSVVDFNSDGYLDVIMGGTTGSHNGPTTVFLWDIHNDLVKSFVVTRAANTIPNTNPSNIRQFFRDLNGGSCDNGEQCTWYRGVGTLNIANIDADSQLEVTFMSGSSLYALDNDFTLKWQNDDDFWESSSGFTGTAVFDFDGDGKSEIIYRDEINLYIVDGTTGEILNEDYGLTTFCSSQTQADYPIVADVDGDGETEIIVSCGERANTFKDTNTATGSNRQDGHIKVYKAANGNYWVPARRIWNQFTYFNVNVNDNMTIPRVQQPHHLNFSQICTDPNAPSSFSLNKFLNQSPRISFCGQLVFPSPKLDFQSDSVQVFPPVCPDNQFQVRLYFENNGDAAVNIPIPVSFYARDPQLSYGNTDPDPYLETIALNIAGGLQVGQIIDTTITVNGQRGDFTLYVSLNDIGPFDHDGNKISNAAFYPLDSLNGSVRECDDSPTIVSKAVNPFPFDVLVKVISDNRRCPGSTTGNNGEVQVFATDGSVLSESDYDFTWTNLYTGDVVSNSALATNLDSGTYEIRVAYNNVYTCQGKTDTVVVQKIEDWPTEEVVTVEEVKKVSSCKPATADGIARVLINGTLPSTSDYDIIWVDEQEGDTVAVGHTASNLKQLLYNVIVTNKLTGCSEGGQIDMTLEVAVVLDQPTVTAVSSCDSPNGSITAKLLSGSKSSYQYILIQHSPVVDTFTVHNNGAFTKLNVGTYELRAYDPVTECGKYTEGIFAELKANKEITLALSEVKPQTACEAPFNGQLSVTANSNGNPTFSYAWYRGFVAPANLVATTATTPDTLSTNVSDLYIVVVTNTSTSCSATGQIRLAETIQIPTVSYTITSQQTHCTPNGSVQVTANPIGQNYRFYLLLGSDTVATNTTGIFTGLEEGSYVAGVKNMDTRCSANTPIFNIQDNIAPFGTVNFTPTPQTNCDDSAPNGALRVDVSGVTTGYTFKWFAGVDTSTVIVPQPATAYELTNISSGDYTLYIRNTSTGCDTIVHYSLGDDSENYMDGLTISTYQHLTFCAPNPDNGYIEVDLVPSAAGTVSDISDYTFYWYAGNVNDVKNGLSAIVGENGASLDNLTNGWYAVRAERNDGCAALDTLEFEIQDLRNVPKPNIVVKIVEQNSCDVYNPNGVLDANVGGTTSGYTFNWYRNNNGTLQAVALNSPVAQNLPKGNYILEVVSTLTACRVDTVIFLDNNIAEGSEIELVLTPTQVTGCDPNNGSITVSDVIVKGTSTGDPDAYSYDWYRIIEPGVDSVLVASATGKTISGLDQGTYSAIATNDTTSCNSIAWTTTVGRDPALDLTFSFTDAEQTDCFPPNGQLEVTGLPGDIVNDYTYQWYLGSDTSFILQDSTNYYMGGLRAESYTVAVTSKTTGCTTLGTFKLPAGVNLLPVPAPGTQIDPMTSCGVPDGAIYAEIDPVLLDPLSLSGYAGYAQEDFFYYWFKDKVKYKSPLVNPGYPDSPENYDPLFVPSSTNNQDTITGLETGKYLLVIVDAKNAPSYGCRSVTRQYIVPEEAKKPALVSSSVSDNTMCSTPGNGHITVEVDKRSGDVTTNSGFSFYWFNSEIPVGSEALLENITAAPYISTYDSLSQGDYSVRIVDNFTGCDTTIVFKNRLKDSQVPPEILDWEIQAQKDCNTNYGSIEITQISNGYALNEHHFYWYANQSDFDPADPANNALKVGNTGTSADWEYTGLSAGTYWVTAIRTATHCPSILKEIIIRDSVEQTVITRNSPLVPSMRCDGVGTGVISINISEKDGSLAPGGYNIAWTDENGDTVWSIDDISVNPITSRIENLLPGRYFVSVQNITKNCAPVTANYEIVDQPVRPKFIAEGSSITVTDNCIDDGTITINKIQYGTITYDLPDTNFTFEWRYGSNDAAGAVAFNDLVTNAGVIVSADQNEISKLPDGTYYVQAYRYNCASENTLQFVLKSTPVQPLIINTEKVDFIACTGINEGVISVSAKEKSATTPASNYTFTWTYADGSSLPGTEVINSTLTESRISNLEAGDYRVIVMNNSTQCSDTAFYTIREIVYLPVLYVNKIQDQTYCWGNGGIEVSEVTFRGAPMNLNDYDFIWDEGTLNNSFTAPTYGLSTDSQAADSLIQGTYLIKAVHKVTCSESFPIQIDIEDNTQPLIITADGPIDPVMACEPSDKPLGEVGIRVRNSSDFITRWYEGSSITQMQDSIQGTGNQLKIRNLIPGFYTVYIEDTLTGCSTTRTYQIEGIVVPLTVSLSSTPYTSCLSPDGKIAANVNGGSGQYTFTWFAGNDTNTTPIQVTQSTVLDKLSNGLYTVMVQDQMEPECQAVNAEVVIEDGRGREIQITVQQDFPVTNCSETDPNGQLTASVEGDMSRYNFFWYEGRNTSTRPIANGATARNLGPKEYTVIARDKVTGCLSAEFYHTVSLDQEENNFPAVDVSVLSNVTRCTKPNGSAIAVLDSTLMDPQADYEYIWTNANNKIIFRSSRTNVVSNLKAGNYAVTIFNLMTQCFVSEGEVEIIEDIYTPDFEIVTTPSTCVDATGTISLVLTEPIQIVDIEWITPVGYASGFYLMNQPAGDYEVKITDANGCVYRKTATIASNIHTFNGVSPNGDNKNDKFVISCIENFERKTVRIYNRAGALVYENKNYDNQTSYFEGFGNRGLYIGGDKLPDGTYFYIIDKHDGKEPVSGYLELLR